MRRGIVLAGLGGLILATALVGAYGWAEVGRALLTAGWAGLAAISAAHLGFWGLSGLAWRTVLPPAGPRPLLGLIWARWVRDNGSDLLPISSVGRDLIGARSA